MHCKDCIQKFLNFGSLLITSNICVVTGLSFLTRGHQRFGEREMWSYHFRAKPSKAQRACYGLSGEFVMYLNNKWFDCVSVSNMAMCLRNFGNRLECQNCMIYNVMFYVYLFIATEEQKQTVLYVYS